MIIWTQPHRNLRADFNVIIAEKICLYNIPTVLMIEREQYNDYIKISKEAHILLFRYQGKPVHSFDR